MIVGDVIPDDIFTVVYGLTVGKRTGLAVFFGYIVSLAVNKAVTDTPGIPCAPDDAEQIIVYLDEKRYVIERVFGWLIIIADPFYVSRIVLP